MEKLKKSELVTIARQLDQEVKILRGKLNKTAAEPEDLKYHAISYILEDGIFYLVKLKFDSESGVSKVVSKEAFEPHLLPMVKYKTSEFIFNVIDIENRK